MISKSKEKRRLKSFWRDKWLLGMTVDQWVKAIKPDFHPVNYLRILEMALDKLVFERKILEKQKDELWKMIQSPDPENAVVAINIMAVLKPRKFKRVKTN